MDLREIREERHKLWCEAVEVRSKMKKLKDQERNVVIAYFVQQLMKLQTEAGKISELELSSYLNELANEIRNIYES